MSRRSAQGLVLVLAIPVRRSMETMVRFWNSFTDGCQKEPSAWLSFRRACVHEDECKAWSPCFSSWGGVEPKPPIDQVVSNGKTFGSSRGQLFRVGVPGTWHAQSDSWLILRLSQRIQRISGRWTGTMSRRHVWIRTILQDVVAVLEFDLRDDVGDGPTPLVLVPVSRDFPRSRNEQDTPERDSISNPQLQLRASIRNWLTDLQKRSNPVTVCRATGLLH